MKTLSILINKTATFLLKFIHRGGSLPGQLALKCDIQDTTKFVNKFIDYDRRVR